MKTKTTLIRIVQSRWKKRRFSLDEKPEIIGHYTPQVSSIEIVIRVYQENPKANEFGKKVLEALDLF